MLKRIGVFVWRRVWSCFVIVLALVFMSLLLHCYSYYCPYIHPPYHAFIHSMFTHALSRRWFSAPVRPYFFGQLCSSLKEAMGNARLTSRLDILDSIIRDADSTNDNTLKHSVEVLSGKVGE